MHKLHNEDGQMEKLATCASLQHNKNVAKKRKEEKSEQHVAFV
jgi:hypothetical protein